MEEFHALDETPSSSMFETLGLPAIVEAILFAAPSPVSLQQLALATERSIPEIEFALEELEKRYKTTPGGAGITLQRFRGRIQLTTSANTAAYVENFLGLEASTRLSRAGLETLAIIAYQEQITRPQIDAIRGVNSDGVLKSLLSKGMIQEVGRADAPGRPILYAVTAEFLGQFGLGSLSELPPLND
jgi:segregation and condensation protein B